MKQIRKEIKISKLDLLIIIELLKFTSLSKAEPVMKHGRCIDIIGELRVLLGCGNTDVFWENLNTNLAAATGFKSEQTNWEDLWKEAKSSLINIFRFLRDKEVIRESGFCKHMEEIRLFETWTKQEILQNWHSPIEKQIKSLAFLRDTHKEISLYQSKEEVIVTLHISDDQQGRDGDADGTNQGLLSSVFSYLGSFLSWKQREEISEPLSLQDISLDSLFARVLDSKMKKMANNVFGEQAFVDVNVVELSKGKKIGTHLFYKSLFNFVAFSGPN